MWREHPGVQVAWLGRDRWRAVLIQDRKGLDPVQAEQPDVLSPVAPAFEVPMSVEADHPHGVDVSLGRLITPGNQVAEVDTSMGSQSLLRQGIDAFAPSLRRNCEFFVQLRGNPQVEFSRKMTSWLNPLLGAHFKKNIKRALELRTKLLRILSVKICATVEAENFPPEHVKIRVEFNRCVIVVNSHYVHGSTPCCSSHLRIDATAPLSVLGDGCGR